MGDCLFKSRLIGDEVTEKIPPYLKMFSTLLSRVAKT